MLLLVNFSLAYFDLGEKIMKNFGWTETAELLNGRICMLALPIAVIVYLKTGQLFPNVW